MRLDYQKPLWRFCESPWILFLGKFPAPKSVTFNFRDLVGKALGFEAQIGGLRPSSLQMLGMSCIAGRGWKRHPNAVVLEFGMYAGKCWRSIVRSLHDFHPTSDDSGRRYFRESQVQSLRNTIEIHRVSKSADPGRRDQYSNLM